MHLFCNYFKKYFFSIRCKKNVFYCKKINLFAIICLKTCFLVEIGVFHQVKAEKTKAATHLVWLSS